MRGCFSPLQRRCENTPFAPKAVIFVPKGGRRQAEAFPADAFGQRWSKKQRRGELYRGISQEMRKSLLPMGNQGDNKVENGGFGAVSDFCSPETPGLEGSQEERQSLGETQILTKPGSAELCIWGREEKRLRYTKILKTAAGALQAPEFHHHWVCPSGCVKVPEPTL